MEKLVRDYIPEIMRLDGLRPLTRQAVKSERLGLLLCKLHEEAAELQKKPCLEECADVLEVLLAISSDLGYSRNQLFAAAKEKATTRGRFHLGYVLTFEGENE